MKWRPLILAAFMAYFFGLTLKPGAADEGVVAVHPLIQALKSISIYLYLFSLAVLLIYPFRKARIERPTLSPPIVLFSLFFIYLVIRYSFDGYAADKLTIALLGQLLIALFLGIYFKLGKHFAQRVENFVSGLSFWAAAYTVISFMNLLAGYGYASRVPRYFGVADHPNFAGVALAIASVSLFDYSVRRARYIYSRIVFFSIFVGATYLCLLTASRTALGMYLIALLIYVNLRFGRSAASRLLVKIGLILFTLLLVILFSSDMFLLSDSAAINRMLESGDNRSEVWKELWDALSYNPLFGAGLTVKGKESSYLQALAAAGVVFGLAFAASILSAAYFGYRMLSPRRTRLSQIASLPLFVAVMFALMLGALAEGFLTELAGPWVFLYLVSAHIVFCAKQSPTTTQ